MMQGRPEESGAHIHQRFLRDPEDGHTHAAAGYAALRRGDQPRAAEHFSMALRLDPENAAAHEGLLTSCRARSAIYRACLAFSFKAGRLQEKHQRWLFPGGCIAFLITNALLRPVSPALANAVFVLYLIFAFWSHVARGIGTFMILWDHAARLVLRRREKLKGILAGGQVLAGLGILVGGLLLSLLFHRLGFVVSLAGSSLMWTSIPRAMHLVNDHPEAGSFTAPSPWPPAWRC